MTVQRIRIELKSSRFFRVVDNWNYQAARIFCGKRIKQKIVEGAEDYRGCTNAEGESKDGDEREAAVLANIAEGVPEVTEEDVDVGFPPYVSDFFFDSFEATEFEFCAATSFLWGASRGYMVSDLAIEMETELLVELAFGT